jgi:L-lactate permease
MTSRDTGSNVLFGEDNVAIVEQVIKEAMLLLADQNAGGLSYAVNSCQFF